MWPNVQSSLSQNRIDVLRKANEVIAGDEYFKFAYAYMHENLKFILNKPFNGKYVTEFRSKEDIANIISAYSLSLFLSLLLFKYLKSFCAGILNFFIVALTYIPTINVYSNNSIICKPVVFTSNLMADRIAFLS